MKKFSLLVIVLIAVLALIGPKAARAVDYGTNITIFDGMQGSSTNPTYNQWWNTQNEDQEVEPGDTPGQVWDLEAFLLDGTTLTMVGGFNFQTGYGGYSSGDIFIDINGDAKYGATNDLTGYNNTVVRNTFGYDYVLDLDFASLTYTVYQLGINSSLEITRTVHESINQESNPWRYVSGGTLVNGFQNIPFSFATGLSDQDVGFSGGTHYATSVNLGFLAAGTSFLSHFTYGCGNDNLIGDGSTPVPEPGTWILVASGLAGLLCLSRRSRVK